MIHATLRQLETNGYAFTVDEAGDIAYTCRPAADDARGERLSPDEWPEATRWAVESWAEPRLAELSRHRDGVAAILNARTSWGGLWAEWGQLPDDPLRDAAYALRLCELAIAAGFPCYDGGTEDLGAAGWRRVTARMIDGFLRPPESPDKDFTPAIQSSEKENETMGIKIEQTTYEAVPTGEYKAVITEISQTEGKFGPQLQIKSEISAGPYAGNVLLCWVSPKFSPKSRLYEWVEAALAMPVPKSYTFDSDDLIGREVIATLVVRELESGGEVNRVDRVRGVA
jgi:hypothetical protein